MADHRAYGFRDRVVKPFRIRELSAVMARVIRRGA
jgi:DNA-binding response OmpR family regulator